MELQRLPQSRNIIISLESIRTEIVYLHAHHQVIYYYCVKFNQYWFIHLGGVGLTRIMDRQKDGRTGWFLYTFITLCLRGCIKDTFPITTTNLGHCQLIFLTFNLGKVWNFLFSPSFVWLQKRLPKQFHNISHVGWWWSGQSSAYQIMLEFNTWTRWEIRWREQWWCWQLFNTD